MAADFLQSSLFNPTAPSEGALKEAKLRIIRMTTKGAGNPSQKGSDQQHSVNECSTEGNSQSHEEKSILSNESGDEIVINSTLKESYPISDNSKEEIPREKKDSSACDDSSKATSEDCFESTELPNITDLPQVQNDLFQTNVTRDKSTIFRDRDMDATSRTDCSTSATFTSLQEGQKEEENNNGWILNESYTSQTSVSNPSSPKVEEEPSEGDKTPVIEEILEPTNNQKQILRIVRFLFAVKWIGHSNKEDQIHLVGNEMADANLENQEGERDLNENNKRKRRKNKHTSAKRKFAKIWTKWMQGRMKNEKKATDVTSGTKQKKSKKQNMGKVGRHIKSRLGYGCRYIGHGLANMTSIIPEASHVDPMGNITAFSDFECVKNDYYDPNAPSWDFNKGYYVRRTRVF